LSVRQRASIPPRPYTLPRQQVTGELETSGVLGAARVLPELPLPALRAEDVELTDAV
jgi:hypothetical protein